MLFPKSHIINDKYEIIEWAGDGGFGEVYKIKDLASNDIKALKCLLPQVVAAQPELIDLFDKEAYAAMQVEHKNVVKIFSVEETNYQNNKVKFFTMEYTEDRDLDNFIENHNTCLPKEQLLDWMKQLLSGLKAISEKLIHRDLKPSNILIFNNTLKISDFGLSRFIEESTRTLTFKGGGTPQYMSPEVWENKSPTPLVDQYSMGIIFYVLATLSHPFLPIPSGENPYEFLRDKHLFTIPEHPIELNPELPKKLNSIIMVMIEKRPEDRYQNVDDILNALESIEEVEKVEVSSEILDISEIAKKSEKKIKKATLKEAQKRKRQEDERKKIRNIFDFHCKELISSFEQVIDSINEQIEPARIEKSKSPHDQSFYQLMCNFHNSHLKVHIEQVSGVNEVENVIGWGYCIVDEYKDGFNLLLQKSMKSTYARWLAVLVQDSPLYNFAKYTKPHGVLTLDELNNALRGLHASHIYQVRLKEFNKDLFIELAKKLVSQ